MRILAFVSLALLSAVVLGCGKLPWTKRDFPYGKEERGLFADKDLYPIDGRLYLKAKDRATGEVRFVEVKEYLRSPGSWEVLSQGDERETEAAATEGLKRPSPPPKKSHLFSALPQSPAFLKRKMMVLPVEGVGDEPSVLTDSLFKILSQRCLTALPLPYEVLGGDKEGGPPGKEEILKIGHLTGAQAVLWSKIYGPYEVFGGAYCQMELRLYETLEGTEVLNLFLQQTGESPQGALQALLERAASRVDEALGRMGWFTRVARVEGDRVYLLAGRLSGLKEGDVLLVKDDPRAEPFCQLLVTELLGPDLAVGRANRDLPGERGIVLYGGSGRWTEGS